MKITIIVPFYENLLFLTNLLQSLNVATKNSKLDFELIIVNDSPWIQIDYITLSSIFEKKIKLLTNVLNRGVAYSRNIALEKSEGDFIHLIDQDDLVHPNFYKEFESKIQTNLFCLFNVLYMYDNLYVHKGYYIDINLSKSVILERNIIRSPGQVVFSKSLLNNKVQFPLTHFKGADDRFFWMILVIENKNINFKYIKEPYYIAKIHSNNYSHNLSNLYKSCIENWFYIKKNKFFNSDYNKKLMYKDVFLHLFFLKKKVKRQNLIFVLKGLINYYIDFNKILVFLIKRYNL